MLELPAYNNPTGQLRSSGVLTMLMQSDRSVETYLQYYSLYHPPSQICLGTGGDNQNTNYFSEIPKFLPFRDTEFRSQ
jgi:hypothetical protein